MSEQVSLPDEATQQWLRESYSMRPGGYVQWRRDCFPNDDRVISNVHDAWRSARPGDPRAEVPYKELPADDQALCVLTGLDLHESIYQHIHIEREPWARKFGPAFVYFAMQHSYVTYYPFVTMMRDRQEGSYRFLDGASLITAEDSEYFSYNQMSPRVKEVDRRMVMASMVELTQPDTVLCSPDVRQELLQMDNVQRAIADGEAILRAAQAGEPYDQSQGFATEVIHWNI